MDNQPGLPRIFSEQELAERFQHLGVTVRLIRQHRKVGLLAYVHFSHRKVGYAESDVADWLEGLKRLTCMALFVPSELIEIGLERSLDMPKKRPTPEQIVTLLRQIEVATSQGKSVSIACREAGISDQSYYRWRKEYGGLDLDQARRMKDLEKENGRLKRLVADLSLEKQVLKDIASGNL